MIRKCVAAAAFVGLISWTNVAFAVHEGIQQPANCTSPCATRVHYTYSLANKSGIAEWSVIDVSKNNQYIKAQAYCRTSGPTIQYQWQTAAAWSSQNVASSTRVCAAPYDYGIVDNGYVWTQ